MSVTRKQAEEVLALLKCHHNQEAEGDYGPKLIENWDWLDSGPTEFAIVWEQGPNGWAHTFGPGGFNSEIFDWTITRLGDTPASRKEATELATEKEVAMPAGVWVQAVTSWAIGVYER